MLLILDEAQTAFGRVGANFAFEQDGVVPDFLTVSKTLGGGIPLSAAVTSAEIEERLLRARVSSTSPRTSQIRCRRRSALPCSRCWRASAWPSAPLMLGERLAGGLRELQQRYEVIGDVRGAACSGGSSW